MTKKIEPIDPEAKAKDDKTAGRRAEGALRSLRRKLGAVRFSDATLKHDVVRLES